MATSKPKLEEFRDLKIGQQFVFVGEIQYPFSGIAKGPWFKRTARKYQHTSGGNEILVGTVAAKVISK